MQTHKSIYKQKILKETERRAANSIGTAGHGEGRRARAPGEQALPGHCACRARLPQEFTPGGSQNMGFYPPFSKKYIILPNPLRTSLICDAFVHPPHSTGLQKILQV